MVTGSTATPSAQWPTAILLGWGKHLACHPGHDRAREEPVALGKQARAQAMDDSHRVMVEAAQADPDNVGWVGGAPVDDAAGGGLVTEWLAPVIRA